MISQNDIEYLQDMVEREQMTADEANVEKCSLSGFLS